METKVLDFFQLCLTHKIISILFEISASALFLANFSLDIVIKYIFLKRNVYQDNWFVSYF